jgi:hypothetical protein
MIQNKYFKMKLFIGAIFMCLSLIMVSCTDKFEDYNTDPNRITDEDSERDYLNLGGMFPTMQVDVIPTSDIDANEYQRAQNLSGDIFSGYMAAIGQWNNSSNNSTYNMFYSDWNDVAFNVAYRSIMGPWEQVKEKSEEYNVPSAFALAQIIKIASLHRITDCYGPIPYSRFGESALGSPYDSQEQVYKAFFTDLDAAIKELKEFLSADPTAQPFKKYDLIYLGDYAKWVKYANSLKLRLAMRISYVEPELAKQYAQEAVNDEYGVMTENADNAVLKSGLGVSVYNPLEVCWNRYNDCRAGASLESFLKGYNDPRLAKYFTKVSIGGVEGYYGARNGVVIGNKTSYEALSSPAVYSTDPITWMTAAEVYFLRAEGALRGWNMSGNDGLSTAEVLYNKGIEMSFEQRGVSSAYAAYVNDDTSVPANFVDKVGGNGVTAATDIKIKWDNSASFEKNQERILTQKWLAMFPEGQEAWSEYRRTGYPKIFPVVRNNSNGTIDTQKQIRRLPFPQSEYRANMVEVEKAVTLLGGADNGGTKLWWDKK